MLEGEWYDIPGYSNYLINRQGDVYSKLLNKLLKRRKDQAGYISVALCSDSGIRGGRLHRLLGFTFIPNPENKPFINHINGIKDDNRIENLEWVTRLENVHHAMSIGLIKKNKTKDLYTRLKIIQEENNFILVEDMLSYLKEEAGTWTNIYRKVKMSGGNVRLIKR